MTDPRDTAALKSPKLSLLSCFTLVHGDYMPGGSAKDSCHPGEFLPSRIRIRVTHRDGLVDIVTTPYAMRATEVG